jgi:radical SAM superfamily enzyme
MFERYDIGPIRPPSEAGSLLIRVNRNCPWNKCEFCMVYKGQKFQKKTVEEVKQDIDNAADFHGRRAASIQHAFLQDADALIMKTSDLVAVLNHLKGVFPAIDRITTYARTPTLAAKSVEELVQLKDAGLSRIHVGLETGNAELLKKIKKGTTPEKQIEAGRKVMESGISLSEYIMPGLGGKQLSREHAIDTAKVLNAINPNFIRVRTMSLQPGAIMFDRWLAGEFEMASEEEIVRELRLLIETLDGITSTFVSDHMLNLMQEIEGTFPQDKQKMLDSIDRFLNLPDEEKELFIVGSRLNILRDIEHLSNPVARMRAGEAVSAIKARIASRDDEISVEGFLREAMQGRI